MTSKIYDFLKLQPDVSCLTVEFPLITKIGKADETYEEEEEEKEKEGEEEEEEGEEEEQ